MFEPLRHGKLRSKMRECSCRNVYTSNHGLNITFHGVVWSESEINYIVSDKESIAMRTAGDCFFRQDNAPAHTDISVYTFMIRNGIAVPPPPSFSPDVAPSNFSLFPRMKRKLKGRRFSDVEEVKRKTTGALTEIREDEYKKCSEKWQQRFY